MSKLTRHSRMSSQSRRSVRTATALGTVALGLVALSACDKPTPMVTAAVNGDSVSTEAACYDDGKAIPEKEVRSCLEKKAEETISVGTGDKLRIGVEPETADSGWLVLVDGKPALPDAVKKTYYSFPGEAFFQQQSATGQPAGAKKSVQVSVVETSGGDFKGIWHFHLKNSDG